MRCASLCMPIVGFASKDREQDRRRNTKLMLDRHQLCTVLFEELAAFCREALDRRFLQIIRRCLDEFRLTGRCQFRPTGQNKFGQRQIRLKPPRGHVESRAGNTEFLCLGPQRLQPTLKGRVRRRCGIGESQCADQGGTKKYEAIFIASHCHRSGNGMQSLTTPWPAALAAPYSESSAAPKAGRSRRKATSPQLWRCRIRENSSGKPGSASG